MKSAKKNKSSYSSFWLGDRFKYKSIFADTGDSVLFNDNTNHEIEPIDILQLFEARDAISNFVRILTNRNDLIVNFTPKRESQFSYTDGKHISISANLDGDDFDVAVGVALHEASHIVYTNFDEVRKFIENLHAESNEIVDWTQYKTIWNCIEDFYVDEITKKTAPGYVAYYNALYDEYFNLPEIDRGLQSTDYGIPSWKSYFFHICNVRNKNRNPSALPKLDVIFDKIDIENIIRLTDQRSRLVLAKEIFEIIAKEVSLNIETAEYVAIPLTHDTLPKSVKNKIERYIKQQNDFLHGNIKKAKLEKEVASTINNLIDINAEIVQVANDKSYNFSYGVANKMRVLVIRKITDTMRTNRILNQFGIQSTTASDYRCTEIENAIQNGKKLANKLLIRNEDRITVTPRLKNGKIDRRLLHELGFDNYEIFNQLNIKTYVPIHIHVSIDQSGSMAGRRMIESLSVGAMLSTAALYINNLHVTVSIRGSNDQSIPYIAYIFDSKINNLSHIRSIFPSVVAHGSTPEGLCFEAIQTQIKKDAIDNDAYFINICDGIPAFSKKIKRGGGFTYRGGEAERHCREQMIKIEQSGTKFTAYFIGENRNHVHGMEGCYGGRVEYLNSASEIQRIADVINSKLIETLQ